MDPFPNVLPQRHMDTFPNKHPEEKRLYTLDWRSSLSEGEMVSTSVWEIFGPDETLVDSVPGIAEGGEFTSVWLEGGTLGSQYKLENKVVTTSAPPRTLVTVRYLNIRELN